MSESENCTKCIYCRKLEYDCRGTGELRYGWCCTMLDDTVMELKYPEKDMCEEFSRRGEPSEGDIIPGRLYRHFKGGVYRVLYLAKQSETKEEYVIYTRDDGDGEVWARPASMWLETVERDGKSQPRFELIFDPSSKDAPAEDMNVPSKPYDLLYEEGGAGTT